ncbi:helix-turn-helix domain-containing protein [Nocardia sp. NPDC048505]|uniref:TetR/AcrR family transcriptional regulator n=1 Tax=unclassified Nocardia TaxID=2637762 RepID=UPI0033EB4813
MAVKELRADAKRNREQILLAAQQVFLDHGPEAPLDRIAERAGIGNATLYRHFPTRAELIRAVAIDRMAQVTDAANRALATQPTAREALAAFAREVVERRIVAMLPILGGHLEESADFTTARSTLVVAVDALTTAAHEQGALRADLGTADLVMFLTVLTRPLPALSAAFNDEVRARMLTTLLDGMSAAAPTALPAPLSVERITTDLTAERT